MELWEFSIKQGGADRYVPKRVSCPLSFCDTRGLYLPGHRGSSPLRLWAPLGEAGPVPDSGGPGPSALSPPPTAPRSGAVVASLRVCSPSPAFLPSFLGGSLSGGRTQAAAVGAPEPSPHSARNPDSCLRAPRLPLRGLLLVFLRPGAGLRLRHGPVGSDGTSASASRARGRSGGRRAPCLVASKTTSELF